MSEVCEFCSKGFNTKVLLTQHQKNTKKCVNLQIEKLGRPAHEVKHREKKDDKKEEKKEEVSEDESDDSVSEESNFESEMDFTSDEEEIVEKKSKEVVKVINHDIKELKKDLFTTTRKEEKKEEVKKEEKNERLDKLEKEVGDIKSMLTRIEKILVKKDDEVMEFITKIRLDMESKNETLEILREEFDNMADNYYDIYKKFKYIKEDMEEMVEEKRGGSKRGSRR
jgi:hypothetical protein